MLLIAEYVWLRCSNALLRLEISWLNARINRLGKH